MKFTNKEQFLDHTKRHIDNVKELSFVLLSYVLEDKEMSEQYKLTKNQGNDFQNKLSKVIEHHDYAKLEDSKEFLDHHNLKEPFYEFLFKKTGVELIGEDRETIQKMNELDELTTTILLKKAGFNYNERKLYRFIEHVSDIVERGCNPLTKFEFGRSISRASEYKKGYVSEKELDMMKKLENYYDNNIMLKQEVFMEQLKESNRNNVEPEKSHNRRLRRVCG